MGRKSRASVGATYFKKELYEGRTEEIARNLLTKEYRTTYLYIAGNPDGGRLTSLTLDPLPLGETF